MPKLTSFLAINLLVIFSLDVAAFAPTQPFLSTSRHQARTSNHVNSMVNNKEATAEALDLYLSKYGDKACNPGEAAVKRTFSEMCKVYGADNALDMVNTWPRCLNCDSTEFAPVFKIYVDKFGEEETLGMLKRNPNLLGCRAEGPNAVKAGDDAMYMSYFIAFTRPAGPFLLASLFGLLSLPVVEGITGIPIRANLFH